MFDARTKLSQEVVRQVHAHFPQTYETIIPRSVRLGEAPSFGQTIFQYAPASRGAETYRALAREFLDREEGAASIPASPEPRHEQPRAPRPRRGRRRCRMTTARPILGRGLDALIQRAQTERTPEDDLPRRLPIDLIDPNPEQPRSTIDPETLQELADSLRAVGVLQPLLITPGAGERYTVVAGERRLRAGASGRPAGSTRHRHQPGRR